MATHRGTRASWPVLAHELVRPAVAVLAVTGDGQPALLAHDRGTRIEVLVVGALGMRPARWPPEDLRPGPEPVAASRALAAQGRSNRQDRKSTRLNSSH